MVEVVGSTPIAPTTLRESRVYPGSFLFGSFAGVDGQRIFDQRLRFFDQPLRGELVTIGIWSAAKDGHGQGRPVPPSPSSVFAQLVFLPVLFFLGPGARITCRRS